MVSLNNVDNTTDASKPVSAATQTALDLKAPLASPTFTGTVNGITKFKGFFFEFNRNYNGLRRQGGGRSAAATTGVQQQAASERDAHGYGPQVSEP